MKVSDLVKELNLTVFCGEENLDTVIKGGYTSDLLSDVMGHMEEGMLWITMQTHQNIVAVSTLKDAAAVLIVNGASPDEETLQKGKDEDIPLLGTSLSAFVIVGICWLACLWECRNRYLLRCIVRYRPFLFRALGQCCLVG